MNIKGYFGSLKDANIAVEKLKAQGFKNSFVDDNEHCIGNRDIQIDLASTSNGKSLANLSLNSRANSMDKGNSPFKATSSMGNIEEITDINYCVIVNMDGGDFNLAKNIIMDMGGTLEEPNVSRYKAIARNDIEVERPENQGNQVYTKRD